MSQGGLFPPCNSGQGNTHHSLSIPATGLTAKPKAGEKQKARSNSWISSTEMSSPRLDVGFTHALEGSHNKVLTFPLSFFQEEVPVSLTRKCRAHRQQSVLGTVAAKW